MNIKPKYYNFVVTAMFTAIIFILQFTPIGFIPLGFINATIIHIPVILGSILLGPKYGAFLGGMFGAASLVRNTLQPVLISFVFSPLIPIPGSDHGSAWALLVCFIPRIMVGVIPYYVYQLLNKHKFVNWLALPLAAIAGSLTNTLVVMHFIFFLFRDAYANAMGLAITAVYSAILGIIAFIGVPEAIVAGVIVTVLGKVLLKSTTANAT